MMRRYQIRHLPVLREGKLVGMLSQRDLHFMETLSGVDPEKVPVGDAMSTDTYTVGPRAALPGMTPCARPKCFWHSG
jgi:acetoin utilization protein AcuB